MIVYARTDRTGQVREVALHDSGGSMLGSFAMQQALNYKFKPLIVKWVILSLQRNTCMRQGFGKEQ